MIRRRLRLFVTIAFVACLTTAGAYAYYKYYPYLLTRRLFWAIKETRDPVQAQQIIAELVSLGERSVPSLAQDLIKKGRNPRGDYRPGQLLAAIGPASKRYLVRELKVLNQLPTPAHGDQISKQIILESLVEGFGDLDYVDAWFELWKETRSIDRYFMVAYITKRFNLPKQSGGVFSDDDEEFEASFPEWWSSVRPSKLRQASGSRADDTLVPPLADRF